MTDFSSDDTVSNVRIFFRSMEGEFGTRLVGLYRGKKVYVHWDSEDKFDGEGTYICDLSLNPKSQANYFATFVSKDCAENLDALKRIQIDASAIAALTSDAYDDDYHEAYVANITHTHAVSGSFIDGVENAAITRISCNELASDIFGDGNYKVCISPNGRRMSIWPEKYGRISSKNHFMSICGLAYLVQYTSNGNIRYTKAKNRIDITFGD